MNPDQGQANWQATWQTRGPKAWALRPLAALYGALSALRRWLYARGVLASERLPVPVVVVGNVVVGGAGKTPTVLALVQHLRAQGWHPGVVSRGYGREGETPLEIQPDTPSAQSGDEPALIRRQSGVPVFVARQRAQAARALLAAHPSVNIVLCDDGLQHLALARDLAIAVFDDRGTGNGWLLPAGLLREHWPPRHGHVHPPDLVLQHTALDTPPALASPVPRFIARRRLASHAVNAQGETRSLQTFAPSAPIALAGIARPGAFFDMLRAEGIEPSLTLALPDHAPAARYAEALRSRVGTVLCTEKDAVKLFEDATISSGLEVWAVPLALHIDPAFFAAVDAHLARLKRPVHPA